MTTEPAGWIRVLRAAAPVIVIAYAVFSVALLRNLVADGSVTLVNALVHEGFWKVDPYRTIGGLWAQAPFAIATAAGVNDVALLQRIHGIGYVVFPSLLWAGALWISRSSRWYELLLLGYCATVLTSGFVAVGDTNQLFAFTALCFAATVRFFTGGGKAWAWLATVCALAMTLMHGLALLLAPLLIGTIVLLRRRSPYSARVPWNLSVVFLAIATLISVVAIVRPYSAANILIASDMGTPLGNPQLRFLIVWLVLLPVAVLVRSRPVRLVAGAVLVAALVWLVADQGLWGTPMQQHASRTISAILLFVLLAVALLVALADMAPGDEQHEDQAPSAPLAILAFTLLLAFLVPTAVHTVRFHAYMQDFAQIITSRSGYIPYDDFVAELPSAAVYGWSYSFPSMSVVLGLGRDHAMVLSPEDMGWVPPIDPYDPPIVPERFTGYGAIR